jgi:hypothetical protein
MRDYFCNDCGRTEPHQGNEMGFQTIRRHLEHCDWQIELQRAGEPRERFTSAGRPCCWMNHADLPTCADHARELATTATTISSN